MEPENTSQKAHSFFSSKGLLVKKGECVFGNIPNENERLTESVFEVCTTIWGLQERQEDCCPQCLAKPAPSVC